MHMLREAVDQPEPKFKVGDWVRDSKYTHIVVKIKSIYFSNTRQEHAYKSDGVVIYESSCELWEPKEGDWCWSRTYGLVKIMGIVLQTITVQPVVLYVQTQISIEDLEPFKGNLPLFITEVNDV